MRDPANQALGRHKPIVMPGKYDGTTPLKEYIYHFSLVAKVNGWSIRESALHLGVSLTGSSRRQLHGIDIPARDGFVQLVMALERKFQPRDQEAMHHAQLKSRKQQKAETVSQLADSIQQLVKQSYPSADS